MISFKNYDYRQPLDFLTIDKIPKDIFIEDGQYLSVYGGVDIGFIDGTPIILGRQPKVDLIRASKDSPELFHHIIRSSHLNDYQEGSTLLFGITIESFRQFLMETEHMSRLKFNITPHHYYKPERVLIV